MKAARVGTSGTHSSTLCGAGGAARACGAARSVAAALALLGLQAHAQAEPAAPQQPASISEPSGAGQAGPPAAPQIRYRYVLDAEGLRVLAQQGAAEELGAVVPLPGRKTQVLAHGSHLYVACGTEGVAILDARQPAAPVLVGYLAEGEPVTHLGVIGSMLLVSVEHGEPLAFDLQEPGRSLSLRRARRSGPSGLGLIIAGSSLFGAAYVTSAIWSGFSPRLAIPVAGPLTVMSRDSVLLPLAILDAAAQTAGLALLIAGAVQHGRAAAAPESKVRSLRLTPTAQRGEIGLALSGRF